MRALVPMTVVFILVISGGLAVADFVLRERPHFTASREESTLPPEDASTLSSSSVASSEPSTSGSTSSVASSSATFVKKGVSTKKASNIDVNDVLAKLQLVKQQTNEASFILLATPDRSAIQTLILLKNNDRAFLLSWMESSSVKNVFSSLKQALQEQFSAKVTDLVDEIRTPAGGPLVDYLSFIDPALSPERIVFLRVRTRLYEIHVAKNGESHLDQLVENLSM